MTTYSQGYKKWATINYFYNNKTGTYEFTPDELIILTRDSEDGVTSSGILRIIVSFSDLPLMKSNTQMEY